MIAIITYGLSAALFLSLKPYLGHWPVLYALVGTLLLVPLIGFSAHGGLQLPILWATIDHFVRGLQAGMFASVIVPMVTAVGWLVIYVTLKIGGGHGAR